jgi:hypothetical protein
MSETPRTDAQLKLEAFFDGIGIVETVEVEFARELEKELIEARADAKHWKSECNALQRMTHEARAEIESKNRLVEQMREALVKLIGTLEVMSVMPETLGKYPVLAIDAPELEQARAALAAERGE